MQYKIVNIPKLCDIITCFKLIMINCAVPMFNQYEICCFVIENELMGYIILVKLNFPV